MYVLRVAFFLIISAFNFNVLSCERDHLVFSFKLSPEAEELFELAQKYNEFEFRNTEFRDLRKDLQERVKKLANACKPDLSDISALEAFLYWKEKQINTGQANKLIYLFEDAVCGGHDAAVAFFLENGLLLSNPEIKLAYCLHKAIAQNHISVVTLLLKYGTAEGITLSSYELYEGEMARDCAQRHNFEELDNLLEKYGGRSRKKELLEILRALDEQAFLKFLENSPAVFPLSYRELTNSLLIFAASRGLDKFIKELYHRSDTVELVENCTYSIACVDRLEEAYDCALNNGHGQTATLLLETFLSKCKARPKPEGYVPLFIKREPVLPGKTSSLQESFEKAIEGGDQEAVARWLSTKTISDIDAPNGINMPPLHVALDKKYSTIAIMLIKHGAYVNSVNMFGETPLDMLYRRAHKIGKEYKELEKLLTERGAYSIKHELVTAITKGKKKLVKYLLANGAISTTMDNSGKTMLMIAAHKRNLPLIKLLYKFNSNRWAPADRLGDTLKFAEAQEYTEVATFLKSCF